LERIGEIEGIKKGIENGKWKIWGEGVFVYLRG